MTLGYLDPGQTVPWFTTAQIGNWNEPSYSNAEYDRLSDEQISAMDPQQRTEMIWRMQELMYEDAVYPVLTYPYRLQAYDTDGWEGWTPLGYGGRGGGTGPAFYTSQNVETYLNLKPTGESSGGGSSMTATLTAIVVVAAIATAAVVWSVIGRRSGRKETMDEA